MAKQREKVEFRYYEIPEGEFILALLGEDWIREYGKQIQFLHFHNLMEIGYCHWGNGQVVLGQEYLTFSDHSMVIVPPNLPHTTNSNQGTKGFWEWMYIDFRKFISNIYWYDAMTQKDILKRIYRTGYLLSGEKNRCLARLILGIMNEARYKKPYYRESIQGLLQACMAELLRLSDNEDCIIHTRINTAMIAGALDYVDEHYGEKLKIRNMADACSMSESHFRRIFEEGMNMKPGDYVNLIRIQKACELLKKTKKSMEEVATASGFASISAFNRNFNKILKITPYQWKKSTENYEGKLLDCQISAQKGWK